MSDLYESRDSPNSITSQLLFGLLFGNLVAILGVIAFRPFGMPGGLDNQENLVLTVGVLSLVSAGLLFLAATMRRRTFGWWSVAVALDAAQLFRLVLALVTLAAWQQGDKAWIAWLFVFVPFLGILAAVGIVMTARELRKGRRRRLSHAA